MTTLKTLEDLKRPTGAPVAARLALRRAIDCTLRGIKCTARQLDSDLMRACRKYGKKGMKYYVRVRGERDWKAAVWWLM